MRQPLRWRILATIGAIALVIGGCTDASPEDHDDATELQMPDCDVGEPLGETLSSGSSWTMCWSVDPMRGLVLTDISYIPVGREAISVIASLTIAQLEVPYDSGERLTSDITSAGFGGTGMHTLSETECQGEMLSMPIPNIGDGTHGESPERDVLCSEVVDVGLAYRSATGGEVVADRRSDWQLSTISRVGWYEYVTMYQFGADGSIQPLLGATGDLSPVDYTEPEHGWPVGEGEWDYAASHSHNAVWQIHWALGGRGGLAVEQFDANPTGEMGPESPILDGELQQLESPNTASWTDRRWWRVVAPDVLNDDGHPISYQIDLQGSDSFTFVADELAHGADTGYDVAFTNFDECEVHATANRGRCGSSVLDFVDDGAGQVLDDVVSWVSVGYHHVARDEDQSPMEMHWQGFVLLPRDVTATRADLPEEREHVNGRPDDPHDHL